MFVDLGKRGMDSLNLHTKWGQVDVFGKSKLRDVSQGSSPLALTIPIPQSLSHFPFYHISFQFFITSSRHWTPSEKQKRKHIFSIFKFN